MPCFHNKLNDLRLSGPIITVKFAPPQPIYEEMRRKGLPPKLRNALALIDTGATGSCIDKPIAEDLDLIPHDIIKVQTAGGEDEQPLYDIGIVLPVAQHAIIGLQVLEAKLENQPYDALLGRDILMHCTLIYNGWDNSYTLHL